MRTAIPLGAPSARRAQLAFWERLFSREKGSRKPSLRVYALRGRTRAFRSAWVFFPPSEVHVCERIWPKCSQRRRGGPCLMNIGGPCGQHKMTVAARSDHFSKCWRSADLAAPAEPARRLVHRGTLRGETGPQLRSCSRSRGLGASNTFRGVSRALKKYIYMEVLRACALGFGHCPTILEDSRWSRLAGFGGCKRVFC